MTKVDAVLAAEPVAVSGLPLLQLTLREKLEVIRTLDAEVIELIEEEEALIPTGIGRVYTRTCSGVRPRWEEQHHLLVELHPLLVQTRQQPLHQQL